MWDDVIRTCSNQRIFCDSACVDTWVAREGLERGYVMDLATLWRLARDGMRGASNGATRAASRPPPPTTSARSAWTGPFWGLS